MSHYLVTGGGGFIGSNLAIELLTQGHCVRILDDFSTGRRINLDSIADDIEIVEGSILDPEVVSRSMGGIDYVLHQAAVGSVPRSIANPHLSCRANIEGSVNVFLAARDAGIARVIASSSSSVCGTMHQGPNDETLPHHPISPYAVSKAAMENYARVFADLYDIDIVCLRYFNVFGPHQDPNSDYAAVVPRFVTRLMNDALPIVHGDGSQSRDFTYVANVVKANLLASQIDGRISGTYNIACGGTTSVLDLARNLMDIFGVEGEPEFTDERPGDIRFSQAAIEKATDTFGYAPEVTLREGLERTAQWYRDSAHA